jgi:hypothetical protein
MPGRTTLGEAKSIFTHFGLPIKSTTLDNKEFYGVNYESDRGLSVSPILTVQNDLVQNLSVKVHPEQSEADVPREWLAYSPETLISRYGPPSRVDLFLGRVAPTPTDLMVLYFDNVDLIVEYVGTALLRGPDLEMCPLSNKVDFLQIWMGDDPQYPPPSGVPLEEATSLNMPDFAKLMMRNPDEACFNLDEKAFPP